MGHRLRTAITTVAAIATLVVVTAAPAAHASRASDTRDARQGALQTNDFPSGWTGTRSTAVSDAQAIKVASKIPGCEAYVKLRKLTSVLPEARSLDYSDGVATTAGNVVTAFANATKAAAAIKIFGGSTMAPCLQKFTAKGAGGGIDVTVAQNDISDLGDRAVGYTSEVKAPDGSSAKFLTVAVQTGRFVDVYTFMNTDDNPPNDILEAAMRSSLTRLEDVG